MIPNVIQPFAELSLPKMLENICQERRGLVLVAGTTGCGKSTTLAAMVDFINSTRTEHIITIEDPIEFLHRDKKGFVNQREVDVDTRSFASALRAALRQDPDVILVGEMRDLETIQTAMLAAETGHLVLSTLHTTDATETVQRIIAVFQLSDQQQVRLQLASTLKAVVCQRLVRKRDGSGRVPAVEILLTTEYIRDCIVNPKKTQLIKGALAAGVSQSTACKLSINRSMTSSQKMPDHPGRGNKQPPPTPNEFKLRIAGGAQHYGASARDEMQKTRARCNGLLAQ